MKRSILYIASLFALCLFWGCKKEGTYPGAELSPYIALLDLRDIHKGEDITLTKDNMLGATKIAGVVVSDQSGGNIPAGLLVYKMHAGFRSCAASLLTSAPMRLNTFPGIR